jgi:hypothetical protein
MYVYCILWCYIIICILFIYFSIYYIYVYSMLTINIKQCIFYYCHFMYLQIIIRLFIVLLTLCGTYGYILVVWVSTFHKHISQHFVVHVVISVYPFTLYRGFFTPKIVGTFYMQGYKVKEKTAIVPHCTPSFKTQWAPCYIYWWFE